MSEVSFIRMHRGLSDRVIGPDLPSGFRIVPFKPEVHAAVHELLRVSYASGGGWVPDSREWLLSLTTDDEYDEELVFVVIGPQQQLAAVALCWRSAFIKDLVVATAERGKGMGSALLHHVFQHFKSRGSSSVALKVEPQNSVAIRLYHSVGMR